MLVSIGGFAGLSYSPMIWETFNEADYSYMQELLTQAALEDIEKRLEAVLEIFIKNYYEGDRELLNYLSNAVGDIAVRLKNAADNKVLNRMI